MQPEHRNGAFQASFLQLHEQEQKPLHMHIMKDNKSQFENLKSGKKNPSTNKTQ